MAKIYNLTVEKLINELAKYPKNARIVIHTDDSGTFASFYPLADHNHSYSVEIDEGAYKNTVYIGIEK